MTVAAPILEPETQGTRPAGPGRAILREDTILYLDGVTVSFDGFKALNHLSLYVRKGELRAIIGPNGAGKTTMMDVITGRTKPDLGIVYFNEDINLLDLDEADIANLGIGRKFQKPTVFENLSVIENMTMALSGNRRVWQSLFFKLSGSMRDRLEELLALIDLKEKQNFLAGALSHGEKQWLEIGLLLAQDPELLLIDEPVAGMTDAETEQTSALLREISGDRSVVVVEHDMTFVRDLDCMVTVLHEGSVLSEGRLETVQNDERVIEVYLGR